MLGPPLPVFSNPFDSLTVTAPTSGSAGLTDGPSSGVSAAAGSDSALLIVLNGEADATSCVPLTFSASSSPLPDRSGAAGPQRSHGCRLSCVASGACADVWISP